MTNHWADMANSTCIIAWGCNPAENHPASIAHIGRARFPKDFFAASDPRSNKKPAQLIVIDPRKTRTAALCDEANGDKYIRIRPGTDIALANGLVRYMIDKIESLGTADPVRVGFFGFLNQAGNGSFFNDGAAAPAAVVDESIVLTGTTATLLANAGLLAAPAPVVTSADGSVTYAAGAALDYVVDSANGSVVRTATSTIPSGATVLVDYSYGACALMTNVPNNSKYTDARFLVKADGTDYDREALNAGTSRQISNFPKKAAAVDADSNTVYNRLKAHVAPYTLAVTADIVGCSTNDIAFIGDAMIANSRCSSGASTDARDPGYRAASLLYAMGITQHTCGGQNVKSFAVLQTLMGNMGRAGGGINALRGIHNVQGSTDMGLLYGNIPAYSGNPTVQVDAIPSTNNAFGKYMDALWGTPLSGTGNKATMNASYDDAYNTAAQALQQRGFYNMTLKWFGDYASINAMALGAAKRAAVDTCYSLWPKGNGNNHIQMFRDMAAGTTKACVAWGQNPAVTEPNQGAVRAGLYEVDLLVCSDLFLTETGAVSRKPTGVTFLFPAAAHVEKAGSVTNSGRTLQWRYEAVAPRGNCKDDTELLLRFAKALDLGGAFQHIMDAWTTNGIAHAATVYDQLYGNPYGGFNGLSGYSAVSGVADKVVMRRNVSDPVSYVNGTVTGSEWVNENVYREMTTGVASTGPIGGGTIWIYTNAYTTDYTSNKHAYAANWGSYNRAKCRGVDDNGQLLFGGWGYSWLVNRRVLYNNSEVPGDVADFFMGPDSCSRLFVSTSTAVLNYSRWYRTIHRLADKPDVVLPATVNAASPHFVSAGLSYAGRFPAHVEPYETPRSDLATLWGRNTKGGAKWDLTLGGTKIAGRDFAASSFPLVMTSIRCVEHFQGGPTTRNNHWNVEASPEPWVELNSTDARTFGIKDGDMVKIVTARTEDLPGDMMPKYGEGFRARVGVGLQGNQRVAAGLVAIPWHWGDKGLSTGSRANDLCIDAMDANTAIPEYKACLCRIEKM